MTDLRSTLRRPGGLVTLLVASWLLGPRAEGGSIHAERALLPAVHITGATGVFRTRVEVFNPSTTTPVWLFLYYTPADTDGTNLEGVRTTEALGPRQSVTFEDIVFEKFGYASSSGLLDVQGYVSTTPSAAGARKIVVTSNTYNVQGQVAGTYGQFSPGQPARDANGFDDSIYGDLYVTGLKNDPDFRTNAVVMNPSASRLEARVVLVDAAGQIYGDRLVVVPPYSMSQLNDVFGSAFAAYRPALGGPYRLTVYVDLDNGAKVLTYATVTDKRTGDPYLITGTYLVPDA